MKQLEFYYDFRSPYAYFAFHRLSIFTDLDVKIIWKPVSVSALLNLQVDREPLAEVIDPLIPAKRQHFMADLFRLIEYWQIPFAPPMPSPPVCDNAMAMACILDSTSDEYALYIEAVFKAVWQEQLNMEDSQVLEACLPRTNDNAPLPDSSLSEGKARLIKNSIEAFNLGVFGTPSFIYDGQLYFGADRMEVLASII